MAGELRVGEFLTSLIPRLRTSREIPLWPPDVFGLLAALVQRAGVYGAVLAGGPAKKDHADRCRQHSKAWRRAVENDTAVPAGVRRMWDSVLQVWSTPLGELAQEPAALQTVLQLLATADECGEGLGGEFADGEHDDTAFEAMELLTGPVMGSTLCREIHPSRLRVLPKRRTPQSGLNIRSLSLHLTCVGSHEVVPQWTRFQCLPPNTETINLLVIPFPFAVDPLEFVPAEAQPREMPNMDRRRFGFFTTRRASDPFQVEEIVKTAILEAERCVGRVHVVLFPETSLAEDEYLAVRAVVEGKNAILMAGVGVPAEDRRRPGTNSVRIVDPYVAERVQNKHHRWKLNRSQIVQYELGATLNPAKDWWEYIAIHDRRQHFIQLADWMLVAPLICEDLARPDPAGDLVRAVGPDLVIAFLMDGPQLATRWPARYATVLADDPGCSVLTITSLGMALRCRPPEGKSPSRQIAIWKDPVEGVRGIEAPNDKPSAVVLTLNQDTRQDDGYRQASADGRVNRLTSGFPILSRVQWIGL